MPAGLRADLGRYFQPVRQLVRERPSPLAEVRPEQARGNLDAQVALAVLAVAEVADQRQERADLPAGKSEVGSADVLASLARSQLLDAPQIEAPVAAANDEAGEGFPVQHRPRRV